MSRRHGDAPTPIATPRLFHAAAILFFLALIACHYDRQTGFTQLIYFGDRFAANRLPQVARTHPFEFQNSVGYDGQFYAQLAVSPLLADAGLDTALDNPAYRSRRIGLPWLAWFAGLGQTPWVLQAYALLNVFAWLALAALLLHWIPPTNATALLAWLGCLFGVGVMMSVGRALTDLPSALLIALAVLLAERGRRLGAGVVFALSLLTRETSVLAGVLLLPDRREGRRAWVRAILIGMAALAPLVLWLLYVHRRFPSAPGVDGDNFGLPFAAMLGSLEAIYRAAPQRGWHVFAAQLLSTLGLCVQFLFLAFSARHAWRERWWRVGAMFALLFAVLGPAVWEDYTAAARAAIPMTLAFNILLRRNQWWSFPLCLLGNLPLLHGLAYLISTTWTNLP
jgi:hypothetical protein